jgi:rod shape-determining protein MreB
MFERLRGLNSYDLAVDLGTANSLIYVRGKGIVLNEPSVIAIRGDHSSVDPKRIAAVGNSAKRMLGRTPDSITVTRPLREGVIANYTVTEAMLKYFIHKVHARKFLRPSPRVVVGVPCGSTQVERRAIRESVTAAGARGVYLLEEPVAAAIGAGLPIGAAVGSMVLDIGGGTTEVAVISLNGIVYAESLRLGGDRFDEVIINYVRRNYGIVIGETTAERIKVAVGSAYPGSSLKEIAVHGGNIAEGIPRRFVLNSNEILEALQETLGGVVSAVRRALERTPPELISDISDRGLVLTGGGALLAGLDRLISEETGVPVKVAEDPLTCVVRGAGQSLDLLDQPDVDLFINE